MGLSMVFLRAGQSPVFSMFSNRGKAGRKETFQGGKWQAHGHVRAREKRREDKVQTAEMVRRSVRVSSKSSSMSDTRYNISLVEVASLTTSKRLR